MMNCKRKKNSPPIDSRMMSGQPVVCCLWHSCITLLVLEKTTAGIIHTSNTYRLIIFTLNSAHIEH